MRKISTWGRRITKHSRDVISEEDKYIYFKRHKTGTFLSFHEFSQWKLHAMVDECTFQNLKLNPDFVIANCKSGIRSIDGPIFVEANVGNSVMKRAEHHESKYDVGYPHQIYFESCCWL